MTTNNLRWAKVNDATNGYRVYFNDSNTFRTNFPTNATTNWVPGLLTPGTYTWRVDTTNVTGVTTGTVWTFTASLPDQTANSFPADGTVDVTNYTPLCAGGQ